MKIYNIICGILAITALCFMLLASFKSLGLYPSHKEFIPVYSLMCAGLGWMVGKLNEDKWL